MEVEFTKQFAALAARQNPESAASSTNGAAIPARNGEAGSAESLARVRPARSARIPTKSFR